MIFVDTSAWYARAVAKAEHHEAATRWFNANRQPLITTDYVIDETLTLLRSRGQHQIGQIMGQQFFAGKLAKIHFLTEDDVRAAWDIYHRFDDKEWSFTDCASKWVMEKLGLAEAFTFDHHFQQFGTVRVVP